MPRNTPNRKLRLGQRDTNVLQSVAESLLLATSQLAMLYFPSVKKASERLKQLVDAGYLSRSRQEWIFGDTRTEHFFRITDGGREHLRQVTGQPRSIPSTTPPRNVQHLAATNQFVILLRKELDDAELLDGRCIPSWCVSSALPNPKKRLPGKGLGRNLVESIKPDAIMTLRNTVGSSLLFYIETDLESEPIFRRKRSSQSSLVEKIAGYCAYFDSSEYQQDAGTVFDTTFQGFRVLLTTKSDSRLDKLRNRLDRMGDTHFVWGSTFERIESEGVLGNIWQVLVPGDAGSVRQSLCQSYEHPLAEKAEDADS